MSDDANLFQNAPPLGKRLQGATSQKGEQKKWFASFARKSPQPQSTAFHASQDGKNFVKAIAIGFLLSIPVWAVIVYGIYLLVRA